MKIFWLFILGLLNCLGLQVQAQSSLLVYSTILPAYYSIYTFHQHVPTRITTSRYLHYNPVYSPDGRYIVFSSEQTGVTHLFLLDTKYPAKSAIRLTTSTHFEDQATFTPDGKYILFVGAQAGTANIYKIPFAPGKLITDAMAINLTKNQGSNFHPSVSPDGKLIAFSSNRDYVLPAISSPQPGPNYLATAIFVMDSAGGHIRKITTNSAWNGSPVFSPNGKFVYFYSTQDAVSRIYRYQLATHQLTAVSSTLYPALSPTFMPNGRLAFSAKIDDKWLIVSTKADGSDLQYESDTRLDYFSPNFNPKTNDLVCYAPGPTSQAGFLDEFPGGFYGDFKYANKPVALGPFYVSRTLQQLPDQQLQLIAVRGYFPQLNADHSRLISVSQFSDVVESTLTGEHMHSLFKVPQGATVGLSWSPDQRYIAVGAGTPFAASNANVNILLYDIKNRRLKNITKNLKGNQAFPRFADLHTLIFRSGATGTKNIYSININGTQLKQLTTGKIVDTMPAVSHDGKWVAFSSVRDGQNYHIYLLNINSQGKPGKLIQLTQGSAADVHPFFSPDGHWVAFASSRGGYLDEAPLLHVFSPQPYGNIYAVRIADHHVVRLNESKWESSLPYWG